jgi:hypothetical protein
MLKTARPRAQVRTGGPHECSDGYENPYFCCFFLQIMSNLLYYFFSYIKHQILGSKLIFNPNLMKLNYFGLQPYKILK